MVTFLVRYFTAINDHDYQAFVSLLDAQEAARWTPARFAARFGTTKDSGVTLTGIATGGGGGAAASVTFTSHQAPSESADGSSCDLWSITLYLIPANDGYVIEHPPSDYSARVHGCLPCTSRRRQPCSARSADGPPAGAEATAGLGITAGNEPVPTIELVPGPVPATPPIPKLPLPGPEPGWSCQGGWALGVHGNDPPMPLGKRKSLPLSCGWYRAQYLNTSQGLPATFVSFVKSDLSQDVEPGRHGFAKYAWHHCLGPGAAPAAAALRDADGVPVGWAAGVADEPLSLPPPAAEALGPVVAWRGTDGAPMTTWAAPWIGSGRFPE